MWFSTGMRSRCGWAMSWKPSRSGEGGDAVFSCFTSLAPPCNNWAVETRRSGVSFGVWLKNGSVFEISIGSCCIRGCGHCKSTCI
eukprot:1608718-Amphidinium_carterae.2